VVFARGVTYEGAKQDPKSERRALTLYIWYHYIQQIVRTPVAKSLNREVAKLLVVYGNL